MQNAWRNLRRVPSTMKNSFCDISQRSKLRVALYFKRVLARLAHPFPEITRSGGLVGRMRVKLVHYRNWHEIKIQVEIIIVLLHKFHADHPFDDIAHQNLFINKCLYFII